MAEATHADKGAQAENAPTHEDWEFDADPDTAMSHVWTLEGDGRPLEVQLKAEDTGEFTAYDWGIGIISNSKTNSYKPYPAATFDSEAEAMEWAEEALEKNADLDRLEEIHVPEY